MSNKRITSSGSKPVSTVQAGSGKKMPTSSRVVTKGEAGKTKKKTKTIASGAQKKKRTSPAARVGDLEGAQASAKKGSLARLNRGFLNLHEKAIEKMNEWGRERDDLLRKLPLGYRGRGQQDASIPREVVDRVNTFVGKSVIAHSDLTAAVVNTLRATHKAVALVDIDQAMKTNKEDVELMIETLGAVQGTMALVLEKDLKKFTVEDLNNLKENMEFLKSTIKKTMLDAVSVINEDDIKVFQKQLQNLEEMSKVFDDAQKLLTGSAVGAVAETEESTLIQIEKDGGIAETLKKAMDDIRTADINDARFWNGIAAAVGAFALSLVLAAILVGLLVSGIGTLIIVAVLVIAASGAVAGAIAAALVASGGIIVEDRAGILGGIRSESTYTHIEQQLKKLLNLAPPLVKDLKDSQKRESQ